MNRTWLGVLLIAGCGEKAPPDDRIPVTCTVGMVADMAREIGGDRVRITQLMGEGVDPHTYKSSPGDVEALSSARIVFYSGLHLEGKMAELLERQGRRKPSIAVAESLDPKSLLDADGTHDPHVWFDVSMWSKASQSVGDALAKLDPDGADGYQARTAAYRKKLDALHEWATKELASIPEERRVLVTAHDAFRYFGRAYGIEVKGIQGISTESEAGVKQVNDLVDFLVSRKIKAVFVESSVSERNVQALVEGCSARGHKVRIGGELFSDAMGKDGTAEGTYEGMVRHNVRTIAEALK